MIPVLCTHVKALSLPRLEDALLADDWALPGCLVWDYWRSHNVRDFMAEPWHWATPPDPSKSRTVSGTRKVSMVMPVPPQPMCPPETRVTVSYDVGLAHDEHGKDILHVKSSAVSHDASGFNIGVGDGRCCLGGTVFRGQGELQGRTACQAKKSVRSF